MWWQFSNVNVLFYQMGLQMGLPLGGKKVAFQFRCNYWNFLQDQIDKNEVFSKYTVCFFPIVAVNAGQCLFSKGFHFINIARCVFPSYHPFCTSPDPLTGN